MLSMLGVLLLPLAESHAEFGAGRGLWLELLIGVGPLEG